MGKKNVLKQLLRQAKDHPDKWMQDDKIRLETLLWGGDEIIWVVPAWKGWETLELFYKTAKGQIKLKNVNRHNTLRRLAKHRFKHAAGIVFSHHKTPIHRLTALAHDLAELAKNKDRNKNLFAVQALESFDHTGSDLKQWRIKRAAGFGAADDLLIDGNNMSKIKNKLLELKALDFPKSKLYQIVHAQKNNNIQRRDNYLGKLDRDQTRVLGEFKQLFNDSDTYWLHLIDLWDYIVQE